MHQSGGNITSKKLYALAYGDSDLSDNTVVHDYAYTYNATWKDKLASYDGNAITYDNIGNPLTYNGWTCTWEAGRQLKQMVNGSTTLQFKYNDAGLRTQKINGSTTTKYYWSGSVISHMTSGSNTLHFYYDAAGMPTMVTYNGTNYYYKENLQGDIIGIMDMAGNTVVSYVYDSWGKQLSCTGSLANTLGTANPLRYRGYIYDEDSGLYYLQSRYYNPEWGRFLNADCNLSTAVFEFNGYFTYCMNNPVMFSDYSGFIAMCMNDDTDEGYKSFLRRRINETAIYSTRDKTNGIDNPVETIHIDNTNTYLQLYSIEEPLWQFYIASDIWHNYKSRTGDYYPEEEGKIAFELYIHMAAYKLNFRVEQSRVTEIYAYETGFFQDVINYMYNRMDIRDTYRSIINSIER